MLAYTLLIILFLIVFTVLGVIIYKFVVPHLIEKPRAKETYQFNPSVYENGINGNDRFLPGSMLDTMMQNNRVDQ